VGAGVLYLPGTTDSVGGGSQTADSLASSVWVQAYCYLHGGDRLRGRGGSQTAVIPEAASFRCPGGHLNVQSRLELSQLKILAYHPATTIHNPQTQPQPTTHNPNPQPEEQPQV